MTRRYTYCLLGTVITAALSAATPSEAEMISIFNWNDYTGKTTQEDFTRTTGIETNYDVYDSLETLEQKILAGRSGYDIIVPSSEPTLSRFIRTGAVRKLDKSKIPNLAKQDPKLLKQLEATDPGNQYAAIYQWGTVGIGIVPEKIKALYPDAPLDSWDLLFKPENAKKLAPCGITLLDSATDVIPSALHYLGLDPNSQKKEDLAKAEKLLLSIRPFIKNFVTGQNINNLAGADTCIAMAYNGDVYQAANRAKEAGGLKVEFVAPKEGVQVWIDTIAVPSDAPDPEGAYRYINFVLDPKNMAGISATTNYANGVPASWPMLDPEVRANPAVFPTEEALSRTFTLKALPQDVERQRTRSWTKIKTGK